MRRQRSANSGTQPVVKARHAPVPVAGCKSDHHDLRKNEEAGDLRSARDEGGARAGRALVGVRRPEMKRHGGDFESEADHDHDQGGDQQRISFARGELRGRCR